MKLIVTSLVAIIFVAAGSFGAIMLKSPAEASASHAADKADDAHDEHGDDHKDDHKSSAKDDGHGKTKSSGSSACRFRPVLSHAFIGAIHHRTK